MMFVKWQKRTRRSRAFGPRTDTHWAAILAESSRVDGKPTQRHIAYLGGITESAIELPAQRAFFWQEVAQQLDQLALPKDDRARIEAAVEAKVPRLPCLPHYLPRRFFAIPPSFGFRFPRTDVASSILLAVAAHMRLMLTWRICASNLLARLVRLTVAFYGRCNWLSVFCGLNRFFP